MRHFNRFRDMNFVWSLLLAISLLFLNNLCLSNTIIIPADQPTIQAGIDIAVDFDTVLVQAGTYSGPGNEAIRFNGKSIVLKSESGAETTILLTLDTVRTIYFDHNEDSNAILDGFTISGGYEDNFEWTNSRRGGIKAIHSSPQIKNCNISGCYAYWGGGLFFISSDSVRSNPNIENCNIINNRSGLFGGGIYCNKVKMQIVGSTIEGNKTAIPLGVGGGLFSGLSDIDMSDCIIRNNHAGFVEHPFQYQQDQASQGGGIGSVGGKFTISDCMFTNNWARLGGAIYSKGSTLDISSSTFYNNRANIHSGVVIELLSEQCIEVLLDGNSFVNNYSLEIGSDGIAVSYLFQNSDKFNFDIPGLTTGLLSGNSTNSNDFVIKNNIFAFNSTTPIFYQSLPSQLDLSYNNFWGTVTGPNYIGPSTNLAELNGNISQDPLFCEVSDTGLTLDAQSPCVNGGENGGQIGAFGDGCDMYADRLPKTHVIEILGEDTLWGPNLSIDSTIKEALPWDTIVIRSDRDVVYISDIAVDKSLYIRGDNSLGSFEIQGGLEADGFILSKFCVVEDIRIAPLHPIGLSAGKSGISNSGGNSIINHCTLREYGGGLFYSPSAVTITNGSPLIRNCNIRGLMQNNGPENIIASYNFWNESDYHRIDDLWIQDGMDEPGLGLILYYPFLQDTPTDLDNEQPNSLPTRLTLSQNYPNPFNPVTRIEYTIPRGSHVTLEIFDILGRKVSTLISKLQPAGEYQQEWNAENQASGIYFYKLTVGEETETRKMVLLK